MALASKRLFLTKQNISPLETNYPKNKNNFKDKKNKKSPTNQSINNDYGAQNIAKKTTNVVQS
jgi:hypothetical protein